MAVAGGQLASVSTKVVKRAEKELHQTKIILRHLPPDFSEEKLREVISPFPDHNFFYFFSGDASLGRFGCARAYINFTNESDILPFRDQYDGSTLESAKGVRYRMVIEFAPFQAVPKRRKPDPRCGMIEQDSDYLEFLKDYQSSVKPLPSVDLTYLDELVTAGRTPEVQSTPLVEYLKDKRTSKHRGSRNKVVLFAADSKRKKDRLKSDIQKSSKKGGSKESGRSSKTSSEETRESGKKKPVRDKGEEPVSKVVVILGRDKPKKSSSAKGDASVHASSKERGAEGKGRLKTSDGGASSTVTSAFGGDSDLHYFGGHGDDSHRSNSLHSSSTSSRQWNPPGAEGKRGANKEAMDSPTAKSRQVKNKDRPDQKFYTPRGGRRHAGDETEEKKSDGVPHSKKGGATFKEDRRGRYARGEGGEGRRGGGVGRGGRYPKQSSRHNDHDWYWGNDRYYHHDDEGRGHPGRRAGEVEHEYHFQEDYDAGGGSKKSGRQFGKGREYRREGQYGGGGGGGGDTRSYHK